MACFPFMCFCFYLFCLEEQGKKKLKAVEGGGRTTPSVLPAWALSIAHII